MTNTVYCSQVEAKRDIVGAIWGDVHFSKRPFVKGDLTGIAYETVVSANVNGRLVTFSFYHDGTAAYHRPTIVGDKVVAR
jgi:hypothetical protein